MMMKIKTLVLGASLNPGKYSNKAVLSLVNNGFEVEAIGNKTGRIYGVNILKSVQEVPDKIDTISLYLNAKNQENYIADLLKLKPRRIIFNPGTENIKFAKLAESKGVEIIEGCTLVMLSLKQY